MIKVRNNLKKVHELGPCPATGKSFQGIQYVTTSMVAPYTGPKSKHSSIQ